MPTDAATHGAVSGRRILLVLLGIVLVAVAILIVTMVTRRPDPKLDVLGEVPAFQLTDERGQPFTEQALRGHVTIVSFIFTRCPNLCPLTSSRMKNLQEKTFDVGDKVKLVSFSLDPAYDTPPVLAAYARRYGADPTRWRFVTGPEATIHALVEGPFMESMQHGPDYAGGTPNILHNGYFLLIDPQLNIRGEFDSNDIHKLDELMRDARFLARTML